MKSILWLKFQFITRAFVPLVTVTSLRKSDSFRYSFVICRLMTVTCKIFLIRKEILVYSAISRELILDVNCFTVFILICIEGCHL